MDHCRCTLLGVLAGAALHLLYVIYPALKRNDYYCGCKELVKLHVIMNNCMNNLYRVRESSLAFQHRLYCAIGSLVLQARKCRSPPQIQNM